MYTWLKLFWKYLHQFLIHYNMKCIYHIYKLKINLYLKIKIMLLIDFQYLNKNDFFLHFFPFILSFFFTDWIDFKFLVGSFTSPSIENLPANFNVLLFFSFVVLIIFHPFAFLYIILGTNLWGELALLLQHCFSSTFKSGYISWK